MIRRFLELDEATYDSGGTSAEFTALIAEVASALDVIADRNNVRDWDATQRTNLSKMIVALMKLYSELFAQSNLQQICSAWAIAAGADNSALWTQAGYAEQMRQLEHYHIPMFDGIFALIKFWCTPFKLSKEYMEIPLPAQYVLPIYPEYDLESVATKDSIPSLISYITTLMDGLVHGKKIGVVPSRDLKASDFVVEVRPAEGNPWLFFTFGTPIAAKTNAGAALSLAPDGMFSTTASPTPYIVWTGEMPPDFWAFFVKYDNYSAGNNPYGLWAQAAAAANNTIGAYGISIIGTSTSNVAVTDAVHVFRYFADYMDMSGQGFDTTTPDLYHVAGIGDDPDVYIDKGYESEVQWNTYYAFPALMAILKGGSRDAVPKGRQSRDSES
jgi:hypothetical protein